MISLIYIIPLLFVVMCNIKNQERLAASFIILAVTIFSYSLYYSFAFDVINQVVGYWAYVSIAPAISCIVLWKLGVKGKVSFALTGLFTTIILINLVCLFLGLNIDVEEGYQAILSVFYVVEVLILISGSVTDAVSRIYNKVFSWIHLNFIPAYYLSNHIGRLR